MVTRFVANRLDRSVKHVPGLRHVPVLKVLAAAQIALMAREHVLRLEPDERRRLIELVRVRAARKGHLSEAERDELAGLVARMEPRLLAGHAFDKLSPLRL